MEIRGSHLVNRTRRIVATQIMHACMESIVHNSAIKYVILYEENHGIRFFTFLNYLLFSLTHPSLSSPIPIYSFLLSGASERLKYLHCIN